MGKTLNISLGSYGIAAASVRDSVKHDAGVRVKPQLTLNLEGFFVNTGMEIGISTYRSTPMGANFFDAYPNLYYTLNGGYRSKVCFEDKYKQCWQVRVGRYRYEETDVENNLSTVNAYNVSPTFANLVVYLGWVGGELRYRYKSPEKIFSEANVAFDYQRSDPEQGQSKHFLMAQGAMTVNFGGNSESEPSASTAAKKDPVYLTLAGNYVARLQGVPDSGGPLLATALAEESLEEGEELGAEFKSEAEYTGQGASHGGAFAIQVDWPHLAALVNLGFQRGEFIDGKEFKYGESRKNLNFSLTAKLPKIKRINSEPLLRGGYTFLNQTTVEYFSSGPLSLSQNEHHLELSASLNFLEGQVLPTVGYQMVRGEREVGSFKGDMLFVGLQLGLDWTLELGKSAKKQEKNEKK